MLVCAVVTRVDPGRGTDVATIRVLAVVLRLLKTEQHNPMQIARTGIPKQQQNSGIPTERPIIKSTLTVWRKIYSFE